MFSRHLPNSLWLSGGAACGGSEGVLASAYAGLLQEMWLGSAASVAPMGVKRAIGTFNKQFSGFAQHDAQVGVDCHFVCPRYTPTMELGGVGGPAHKRALAVPCATVPVFFRSF